MSLSPRETLPPGDSRGRARRLHGAAPPATKRQKRAGVPDATNNHRRDEMKEYTFVYDDSTLTLKMFPKDAEIVIDAMQQKGWTLQD